MTVVSVLLFTAWLAQTPPLPPGHSEFGGAAANGPSSSDEPPSYRDVLRQLDASPQLGKREKTFEIASAIGKLYAMHGRYPEAVQYLEESVAKGKAVRDVYLRNKKAATLPIPSECQTNGEKDFEAVAAQAIAREKKGQRAEAGLCARQALGLVLSAEGWLGNALFLKGDAKGAAAVYERILDIDPDDAGARYARGGLALDQGDKKRAVIDLRAFLDKHPDSPRAASAQALLARAEGKEAVSPPTPEVPPSLHNAPPPLSRETVEVFQETEQTPEFLAHLDTVADEAETALAQGRFQDALDRYKQLMPYQPNKGRFRAGMAWALVGLNRQPMADRIWGVAVDSDPASVESLGDTLAKRGDAKGAQAVYSRLATSAPAYAESVGLARKQK